VLVGCRPFSITLQPFVAADHSIHSLFPAKEFAIAIPASLLVLFLIAVGFFIGFTLIKESKSSKSK
jgi:dolichyl-phosphate mannosyltransferase polypeptide 2 regulatory subunit